MFIKNDTSFDVRLAKGHITDDLAVAALVVTSAYRVDGEALVPHDPPPAPALRDPPDTSLHVVWEGVSLTVAGCARGPARPPFARVVELRVGAAVRRLVVVGDRVWEKSLAGGLIASEPRPFDVIELSMTRAFGGAFDVPPGLLPGTDLPHPGFTRQHHLNALGVGFYPDEAHARGAPLPNIERPDQLVRRWDDAPEPAGFSPCRELVGWRLHAQMGPKLKDHRARGGSDTDLARELPSFRILHHAPPDLIFDELPARTAIELDGLACGPVRFGVPSCPTVAFVARGRARAEVPLSPRLRALHVDADRGLVLAVHDLAFRYDPHRAPRAVRIAAAPEART